MSKYACALNVKSEAELRLKTQQFSKKVKNSDNDFYDMAISQKFANIDPENQVKLQTGYISDESWGNHQIFYALAPATSDDANKPVIFWVSGGPGGSLVIFWRSLGGPVTESKKTGFKFNKWTWSKFANIVIVDYPYGTGYSRFSSSKLHYKDERKENQRFGKFMEKWFEKHPKYNKSDIWLSGDCASASMEPSMLNKAYKSFYESYGNRLKGIIQEGPEIDMR